MFLVQAIQLLARDAPDRDFHYLAGTRIYWIPDIDVRTVGHIDNWAELTTPSECTLSSLGPVIVWLEHPDSCVGAVASHISKIIRFYDPIS